MSAEPDVGSPLDSIETRSFDYVPEDERHGQPRQVFYMWFGISATIFSLVTGFVGITLGLSFWWTLVSIILGNVLGALFMAFHAFMNTTAFEGPIAKALGGGDIAWIVGAVVTVPLYLLALRVGGASARTATEGLASNVGG